MAADPLDTSAVPPLHNASNSTTSHTLSLSGQALPPYAPSSGNATETVLKRKLPNDDPPGAYGESGLVWNVEKGELIATSWGLLSAFSLVMGAGLALLIKVGPKTMALMMAFGGGALVEALSVELFGHMRTRHSLHEGALWVGVAAGALGGLIYYCLDRLLNSQGARDRSAFYVKQAAGNAQTAVGETVKSLATCIAPATARNTSGRESKEGEAGEADEEKQPEKAVAKPPAPEHDAHLERGKSAALAIWLGILLDGIPESLVIGLMSNHAEEQNQPSLMYAFVISVFVANFPEALSSAGTMKNCGMSNGTIMGMWTLIFLLTGIGAGIGSYIFPPGSDNRGTHLLQAGIEGTCGGAMLTMISNTVFPHAFEGGGGLIGLASLAGFLVSLSVGVNAVTDEEERLEFSERWFMQHYKVADGSPLDVHVNNVNGTLLLNVTQLISHYR